MSKMLNRVMGKNPVMQFAKRAARGDHKLLFNSSSPHAVSLGLDQQAGRPSNTLHLDSVRKHRMHLNMMKFDIQQRSTL